MILFRVWKNFRIEKLSLGRLERELSRSVPLRSIILYRIEIRKFEAICKPFMKTRIWIFFLLVNRLMWSSFMQDGWGGTCEWLGPSMASAWRTRASFCRPKSIGLYEDSGFFYNKSLLFRIWPVEECAVEIFLKLDKWRKSDVDGDSLRPLSYTKHVRISLMFLAQCRPLKHPSQRSPINMTEASWHRNLFSLNWKKSW